MFPRDPSGGLAFEHRAFHRRLEMIEAGLDAPAVTIKLGDPAIVPDRVIRQGCCDLEHLGAEPTARAGETDDPHIDP